MKLGIVGSRRRDLPEDKKIIKEKILELSPKMLISGGCQIGADRFAEELAQELGISILICYPKLPANSSPRFEFVKAYHERNRMIAFVSNVLIALVAGDRKGGTENTIEHFKKAKPFTWMNHLEIL